MSRVSRLLEVGAKVYTDFSGKFTSHTITAIVCPWSGQSGIGFEVAPMVPKSTGGPIDADWFEPQPQEQS